MTCIFFPQVGREPGGRGQVTPLNQSWLISDLSLSHYTRQPPGDPSVSSRRTLRITCFSNIGIRGRVPGVFQNPIEAIDFVSMESSLGRLQVVRPGQER